MVTPVRYRLMTLFAGAMGLLIAGCETSVSMIPNNDPALRKPSAYFASVAAHRSYEAGAPRGMADDFRAQYALTYREIELANISDHDCSNVEVWINGKYVVACSEFPQKSGKTLLFGMFYDGHGHRFDTNGGANPIISIEVYHDGVMYNVVNQVADLR